MILAISISFRFELGPKRRQELIDAALTPEPRLAANAEPCLQRSIVRAISDRSPDEHRANDDRGNDDDEKND
jgi:hypothetical protein